MSAAAAPARKPELTEQEAIAVLTRMPMLVAMSNTILRAGMIVLSTYEVEYNGRLFTFPAQPFRVMREITRDEYFAAIGQSRAWSTQSRKHFYKIHTD